MLTAKNARLAVATLVSIYGVVGSLDHAPGVHLPTAVAAVLTAVGPIMLALQHWLDDPTTGTGPQPAPGAPPAPVPVPESPPVAPPAPTASSPTGGSGNLTITGGTLTGIPSPPAVIQQPSPAPVPPPEWSTVGAPAPATPNPAPPAPAA